MQTVTAFPTRHTTSLRQPVQATRARALGFTALLLAAVVLTASSAPMSSAQSIRPAPDARPLTTGLAANSFSRSYTAPLTSWTYLAGAGTRGITTGLFNGNSNGADIVTVNNSGDSVSVLLNNGNGTFGPTRDYAAGHIPFKLAVGDFTGLGRRDIAVANNGAGTVSVLICNGDGTFKPARNYPAGDSPLGIAVGDFNADGRRDIVVTNRGASPQGISVLLGNGDGTFQAARFYPDYPTGSDFVVVAHMNNDGKLDLIKEDNYSHISVQLGNGDGTFRPPVSFYAGYEIVDAAVGDVNGDGTQDVVTGNILNGYSSVLLGNGDGTLQVPRTFYAGNSVFSATLGDLNNDNKLDLVTSNVNDHTVSVLFGNGDGTFRTRRAYAAGYYPVSATVADFNRDGWRDLAVADNGGFAVVLTNNGNGTF